MNAAPQAPPDPPVPTGPGMDRDFIARHQIIERYLGGKLPLKGAQDFERYCRAHPQLLDEIGLTERINAALRLLDAGGRANPWEERPKRWWERPAVPLAAGVLAVLLLVATLVLHSEVAAGERSLAALRTRLADAPLDPAESTHTITILPSRTAPSRASVASVGGSQAQLADLKFDVSWSPYASFRVTIDRVDQGRVAILHNVQRDSNGTVHLGFNTSALGPGDYQFTLEGLTWRGEAIPQAWATISIVH